MQKITPFLWYAKEAEEAAKFYTSIFPNSRVVRVTAMPRRITERPPGSVKVVEFVLFGQEFTAMTAGQMDPFSRGVIRRQLREPGRDRQVLECAAARASRRRAAGSKTATACHGRSCRH